MSNRLAADASDMVAAVAPVVGGMSPSLAERFSPSHPVAAYIIQGDADPLIPFAGGTIGRRGKPRGSTVSTVKVVTAYVSANRIAGKPQVRTLPDKSKDETSAERWTYPTGKSGAMVQVDIIKNGGHTWPGKRQYLTERLVGQTCNDYDATEAIWEFFSNCPPREL